MKEEGGEEEEGKGGRRRECDSIHIDTYIEYYVEVHHQE